MLSLDNTLANAYSLLPKSILKISPFSNFIFFALAYFISEYLSQKNY